VLGARNARRLEKAGPEGRAAARLAATSGGTTIQSGAHRSGGHETSGSSPVKQVVSQLTGTSGSDGIGLLLPLLIVMSAVLAFGFLVTRRRSASSAN
jgi:hypothetical protein